MVEGRELNIEQLLMTMRVPMLRGTWGRGLAESLTPILSSTAYRKLIICASHHVFPIPISLPFLPSSSFLLCSPSFSPLSLYIYIYRD